MPQRMQMSWHCAHGRALPRTHLRRRRHALPRSQRGALEVQLPWGGASRGAAHVGCVGAGGHGRVGGWVWRALVRQDGRGVVAVQGGHIDPIVAHRLVCKQGPGRAGGWARRGGEECLAPAPQRPSHSTCGTPSPEHPTRPPAASTKSARSPGVSRIEAAGVGRTGCASSAITVTSWPCTATASAQDDVPATVRKRYRLPRCTLNTAALPVVAKDSPLTCGREEGRPRVGGGAVQLPAHAGEPAAARPVAAARGAALPSSAWPTPRPLAPRQRRRAHR